MSRLSIERTGIERVFDDDEILVSKTDVHGKITYVNDVFVRVSAYSRARLLGAPHSIIRHPEMPRCVFKLMWEVIQGGREMFAYVLNLARTGDHYWVYAHVTPTFDAAGRIVGYHSNRRTASRPAVAAVSAVYAELRALEGRHAGKQDAAAASSALLASILAARNQNYDEFVWSL